MEGQVIAMSMKLRYHSYTPSRRNHKIKGEACHLVALAFPHSKVFTVSIVGPCMQGPSGFHCNAMVDLHQYGKDNGSLCENLNGAEGDLEE